MRIAVRYGTSGSASSRGDSGTSRWRKATEDSNFAKQVLCASYWNQRYAMQSFVDGPETPWNAESSVSDLFLASGCFPLAHLQLTWK